MAVSSVKERFWGRQGNDAPLDETSLIETFARTFLVETDDKTTREQSILADGRIPSRGQQHPDKPAAVVVSRQLKQDKDSWFLWEVDVNYSTLPWPLMEWRGGTERSEEEVTSAFRSESQNQPPKEIGVTNSAGEAYDPPPVRPVGRPMYQLIRRIDHHIDMAAAAAGLAWCVNSMPITLDGTQYAAGTVLFNDFDYTPLYGFAVQYWEFRFSFTVNEDTWKLRLPDIGHWYYKTDDDKAAGNKTYFLTQDGDPITGILDGTGKKLEFNPDDPLTVHMNEFEIYKTKDLTPLVT